ncbi:hypothetical protein AB6N23_09435 [Cellulomonas sp. 179-A 9B4 NHS]|uniref:hypothetical protein n=1 Tax=Cellulomonas sp. 179-A 9B4 NHS TaxID=3142379 RepID=UPI0039A3C90C
MPYEDDPSRGKDRPVLVLDRDGGTLVALMLSSQDHDRDAADEARHGRVWTDVGTGGWDRRRRPSEVRLDRVLRLRVDAVRREGAALDRDVSTASRRPPGACTAGSIVICVSARVGGHLRRPFPAGIPTPQSRRCARPLRPVRSLRRPHQRVHTWRTSSPRSSASRRTRRRACATRPSSRS